MSKMKKIIIFFILLSSSSFAVSFGDDETTHSVHENPFTAKAYLIRYWNSHISNNLPKPSFLLSKASPLKSVDLAALNKLASQNALSSRYSTFCSSANLFCNFDSLQSSSYSHKPPENAGFTSYSNRQFTNYGSSTAGGGIDSFRSYSDGTNLATNSFTKYTQGATGHSEEFASYDNHANIADDRFTNYASAATGGDGDFTSYESNVNIPKLWFTSYDSSGANQHRMSFTTYADDANTGSENFVSYGENGNGTPQEFSNYGKKANNLGSEFTGYSELADAGNDSFKGYASAANIPHNKFKSYGVGGSAGTESFENYRDGANVGDDTFQSYGRDGNPARASFRNYGKSVNKVGTETFKEYGEGSLQRDIEFQTYGVDNSFTGYSDYKGVNFAGYTSNSAAAAGEIKSSLAHHNSSRFVEEGKFFRESMLKPRTMMTMPDIKDKMPIRSFLPRSITSKLPFSSSKLNQLNEIFHARGSFTLEAVLRNAVAECERPPSKEETKRCVGSIEDMIDFAVSVLGHNITVRTTENVKGSGEKVILGAVRGINGGRVTQSISCHQSLFPYLLYYCHSVPKVRVYEADILDLETRVKVNHGVAICHLDTSEWSVGHGAFVSLGEGPGLIEVCHWIFENDMTWATAD